MDDAPVAVTGATGAIGGRVCRHLAAAGVPVRMVARDPAWCPDVPGATIALAASYADGEALRAALTGVRSMLLVSGREAEDRVEQHRTAVDAAVAAGVERVVYTSFLNAAADAVFTLARQHHLTEEHIRASGLAFVFLRDSLYADIVPYLVGEDRTIRGPAAEGKVSWVTRDDIAEVAAAVLLDESLDGATLDLTGPEAITLTETAAILTAATGAPIRYQPETMEEAWESRSAFDAPDWEKEGWITSYSAIGAGELEAVSDTVARVTGHPARTLNDFLTTHRETWRHLR
jgi:uncharacterized protein YbjT (DUF2867 family)